jgi:hypothetical protein
MEAINTISRLRELRGSGYEIVDGEPDIIGWSIKDTSDRKLGVVHDLLFDPEQQKVRYIIANLRDNDFNLDKRKVLIPIGIALLHQNNDNVILDSVTSWQIRALPTYSQDLTSQDEQDMFTIFAGAPAIGTTKTQMPQNLYEHSNYNYDNVFRSRQKNKLKDNSGQRAFQIRQREINEQEAIQSRDYEKDRQFMNEPEEMVVRDQKDRWPDNDNIRNQDGSRDRLIDRIKHMKEDLNQIERDLRNSRDI